MYMSELNPPEVTGPLNLPFPNLPWYGICIFPRPWSICHDGERLPDKSYLMRLGPQVRCVFHHNVM